MKSHLKNNPQVKELLADCLTQLEKLSEERDTEIEEFMEEHAESKFKMNQDVKKKFNMKLAIANKAQDSE